VTKLEEVAGTTYAKEKQAIYKLVQRAVWHLTKEGVPGKETGFWITLDEARKLFDLVMEEMMASAARCGSFRLPNGLGALKVKQLPGGNKRLPTGEWVDFGARLRMTYEGGLLTRALVEAGGEFAALEGRKKPPTRWALGLEGLGTIDSLAEALADDEDEELFGEIVVGG
jgi:hypothetical protein